MSQNFQSEDILSAKTRYRDLVVRIWPYVSKYWGLLSILVIVVTLHTVIGRVLPSVIGYAVDKIIVQKNTEILLTVCCVYLGLEIIRFIFVCIEAYWFQVLGQNVIYDLRSDFITHVQHLRVQYFDKNPVGRVVTRATNDFGSIADLFTAGLVSVFTDTLSLFAIVIAMTLISPKLTLVVMAITPLMLYATFKLSQNARDCLRKIKRRLAVINSYIAENISGMKVIQLYVREQKHNVRFNKLNHDYYEAHMENMKYTALLHPVLNAFNAITVAAALYYGGVLNDQSALAMGSLVAFLTHVQDFLPPLRNILEKYQTFQASLASAERIFTMMDQPQEQIEGRSLPTSSLQGQIEFDHLSFAYNEEDGTVLDDVSFKINPGESVAIVGATGSGKSTVVSLLQRFYEIESTSLGRGRIFLDGQDTKYLNKLEMRKRIGVVSQDFFMFNGTLASNISLNDPSLSPERIRLAALKAHCEGLIARSPQGLDAQVQERGVNLSAGEKQLLNFARVIAFNPDIIILDEATANIDSVSESLIQQATKEVTRGRTSIIIAHRLSTILGCDKILVFDKGQLVEQGPHSELIKSHGIYHNLYTLQLSHQTNH